MAWTPQQDQLSQLAQCLRDSLSGHDMKAQRNADEMLKQAKTSPDINNYLVWIATNESANTGMSEENYFSARCAAVILLKNNVKAGYKSIPEASQEYIRNTILLGLRDRRSQIRNYSGSVVTEVVRAGGILGWPQVLPELVATVANENGQATPETQDGAMGALFKICEDNRRALDKEYSKERPLAFLLPKLLEFAGNSNPKIRSRALAAVNVFLNEPIAFTCRENIDVILGRLVQLTSDTDDDVRRYVCRAFALLADGMPDILLPHIQGIVDYTLSQQRNKNNPELALDAAEFIFESSNTATLRNALGQFLPNLVPVLLDSMVYSEDDQLRLEGDDDDADEEDDAKDIKPVFADAKQKGSTAPSGTSTPQTNGQAKPSNGYGYEDDDLSEGEIDEDEDYGGDPEDEWNLRKCSAASLDSIATHFGGPVFEVTLPWLMENLQHREWPNREAAVLALGAIGPGCIDAIQQHLPKLVPYMITLLNDEQPVVRQITCWALSRFAGWAATLDEAGKQQFFEPMMDGILQRMLDQNKKVQESAASAFATLEEAASDQLIPYCSVIVQQFVRCFDRYKDKNMFILYDCVQTLAEHAGPALAQQPLIDLLMPALITRWTKVQDQSREMFPLLEALAYVATALGEGITPFAKPFFDRCIRIMHQNLEEGMLASTDPVCEQPDKDFLVTSLDLLSAIIQSVGSQNINVLVTGAQPNMFELLAYCMKDANNDVRQSAYALLGDCAIYIFPQLQQYLPTIMELVILQLDLNSASSDPSDPESGFRVINNACWSCGEIAMRAPPDVIAPYVDRILQQLALILMNPNVPQSLNENAAIALGRLGVSCHVQLAPHLGSFASPFLNIMRNVPWTDEKGHAYKGFVTVVLDNPQALEKCLLDFFMEMANAPGVVLTGMQSDSPLQGFEQVLTTYKNMIGDGFDSFLHNMPPPQEQALRQLYKF
jgi:transportin-1